MQKPKPRVPETGNLRVERMEPLVAPHVLAEELPVPRVVAASVLTGRSAVQAILAGRDPRLLMVVGPCSIHDPAAAMEYARRLAVLRDRVSASVELIMRVYFEKPRTTIGWKGLINDPHLNGTRDMGTGLRIARRLLLDVMALGLPVGTEMVGPVMPQYIADLVTWTAIGARTAESQTHREMASGLSMPVGFKNSTDGNLQVALDGMHAASTPHSFLGLDMEGRVAIVQTTGNPDRHLVLRGGGGRTNYDAESVERAVVMLRGSRLPDRVMVDCSHGNSNKDYTRQAAVLREVLAQLAAGSPHIMGLMLESHLHAGHQKLGDDPGALKYGVSITDACIDWNTTESLIEEAAEVMRGVVARDPRPETKRAASGKK